MSIKWGIMGTANVADWGVLPGMKQAQGCQLYAIAGRNEEKVKRYCDKFGIEKGYVGYDALLDDKEVEAIYIPLPNSLHYEWVIKALEAGKHVLCEKPLAINAQEAAIMFETAKKNNRILSEAYAYLHSPYVKSVQEDIKSGIIGDVEYIESAFLTQGYHEDIRLYRDLGGGAMYDLGCYCTTMILTLADSAPVYVKAQAEKNDKGVDIFTTGIMKFENGIRASFNVGMMFQPDSNSRFDRLNIHGTKGCIRSEVEYNQEGELEYVIYLKGERIVRTVSAGNNYALEIEQMNRAIQGEESIYITPEFSVRNAQIIDSVLKGIEY